MNRDEDWSIKSWTDSWVLKAGANPIIANINGIDNEGKGIITIT